MELLFSFYERVQRKGPGSEASTRRALALLPGLPPGPRVVEFGCGSGAATLTLAQASGGSVTAVDIYQPFLDRLGALAREAGLADRITCVRGDMADPPFPDGAFDLVWSEGAIYLVGFEAGLRRWKRLLRPGGFVAVSELTWLDADPPEAARAFWREGYPAMTTMENNLALMRQAGLEPVGHFVLPAGDWEAYYVPLEEQLPLFQAENSGPEARALVEETEREIAVWRTWGQSYSYVFYLGRSPSE